MKKNSHIFNEILIIKNKKVKTLEDKLKIQKLQQQLEEKSNFKISIQ
jgi:hypothetical protein